MIASTVLGFAVGIATGLLVNVLWVKRWRMRAYLFRFKKPKPDILDFKPASVQLFAINRWSPVRPLRRDRLDMTIIQNRPRQKWCDQAEWRQLADQYKKEGKAGDCGYLVDFEIDHHETKAGQAFRYSVAHCDYYEHLATVEYLANHSEVRSKIWQALQHGQVWDFTRSAPPAAMKINVVLVSPEDNFLAIQRSGSVEHKRGLWTVGPNETMVLKPMRTPGMQAEDLFGLAERCIREELGLEPADYGPVNISWMGYDVSTAQVKVYAQVRSHLPEREIDRRMATAHSVFEAQDTVWVPLKRRSVMDIMVNWEKGDANGRIWSASAPHSLQELWRFRGYLNLNEIW